MVAGLCQIIIMLMASIDTKLFTYPYVLLPCMQCFILVLLLFQLVTYLSKNFYVFNMFFVLYLIYIFFFNNDEFKNKNPKVEYIIFYDKINFKSSAMLKEEN